MKLRQPLLILSLLMSSQVYSAININVTTTNDEFGENTANCSLREAIQAVNTRTAFGGCRAGERFGTNRIILEEKEYLLTRGALMVSADVTIFGHSSNDLVDTITQNKPKRIAPTTVINGQFKSRLFNTADSKVTLTLNYLKLINGHNNEYGGAILSGGSLELFNVIFENNKAQQGGAIYLLGNSSSLIANNTTWTQNFTDNGAGAALSMSCLSDLKTTERTVTIQNSSVINNGSTNDKSIIEACGNVNLDIQQATISNNIANNSGGVIHFNDNTSKYAQLNIKHGTIINNQEAAAIKFQTLQAIKVNNSVLAFNTHGSCASTASDINYVGDNNLYQDCDILKIPSTNTNSHLQDQHLTNNDNVSWTDLFNSLGNYGGHTPVYLPKSNVLSKTYVLDKIAIDSCQDYIDQRGSITHSSMSNVEKCDRGSVERRVALAVVDKSALFSNKDKSDRIVEINVLDNDIPSETDLTDDQQDARGAFAKDSNTGQYKLEIEANSVCTIKYHSEDSNLPPYLVYDSKGKLSSELQKESCKYTFTDTNGNKAIWGELFFNIVNKAPIAGDDSFYLAAGASQIKMNLISNDNDDNDGKYGGLCTANTLICNGGYYLRIVSSPSLGTLSGDSRPCPDHTDLNKYMCYRGDITYQSKNNLAPFNDSFTYVVYDNDLGFSAPATVTIVSENAEIAKDKATGGSVAWWSIFGLACLAIYRRRKFTIV